MAMRRAHEWTRLVLAIAPLACGNVKGNTPSGASGEAVLFLDEHRTDEAPLGVWCITRAGSELRGVPVVPAESASTWGEVLAMGDELWLFYRERGAAFAAPMSGCTPSEALSVSTLLPRWSNAAPLYLDLDDNGALKLGKPGGAPILLEESGVDGTSWSPHQPIAWYSKASAALPGAHDLFVLDLGAELDLEATPQLVAEGVTDPVWMPNAAWIAYVGGPSLSVRAWSRAERTSKELASYAERPSLELWSGPAENELLVRLPATSDAEGATPLPGEYRILSLDSGAEHTLLESDAPLSRIEWLWPKPWLQLALESQVTLFDVSNPAQIVTTELAGPVGALSSEPGVAEQEDESGPRLVSGLPNSAEPLRDLPSSVLGSFSPDGKYWVSIDPAFDEQGRLTDHGNLLYVTETASAGEPWLVADLGYGSPGIDGVRWLDATSFAFGRYEPREPSKLMLAELSQGSWRLSERALPGEGSLVRIFATGSDPCEQIPLRRSTRLPGCAVYSH